MHPQQNNHSAEAMEKQKGDLLNITDPHHARPDARPKSLAEASITPTYEKS
jgi:hypothetical protein